MNSTLKRIKEFIDYKGITNQKFEKKVGFSNGAFATQLKNNRTIGVDKLENILREFPEINPKWLLTGEGEMLRDTYFSRLQKIIDSTGLTIDGFRKSIDSPLGLFDDILAGKYELTSKTLDKIAKKYPNINLDWLITGKGEMIKDVNTPFYSENNHNSIANEQSSTYITINNEKKEIEALKEVIKSKVEIIKGKDEIIKGKDEIIELLRAKIKNLES